MMGRTTHTLEKPSGSHYRLEDTSDTSWISRESQPTCCWSSILLFWCDVGYWRCTSSLDQEACALHGRSSAPSFGCAGALVLKLAVCESHLVIGAEVTVFFNSFSTQWSARKCKENDVCVCLYICFKPVGPQSDRQQDCCVLFAFANSNSIECEL